MERHVVAAGGGHGAPAALAFSMQLSSSSSSSTREIMTESVVALLLATWLGVVFLIWLSYKRARLRHEKSKAAGLEENEATPLLGDATVARVADDAQDGPSERRPTMVSATGASVDPAAVPPLTQESVLAHSALDDLPPWHFVLGLLLVYYCASIGIIYMNAWILDDLFPYPATLTMFHMIAGTLVSAFLIYGVKVTQPVNDMDLWSYLTRVVPLAVFYAINLWGSNAAYLYLDVGFIQMLRPVSGVGIYVLLVAARKERPTWSRALTLVVIMGGITVASVGNEELGAFVWVGFWLVISAAASYAVYMVGSQLLMQDSGFKLDPITTLFVLGPPAAIALAVVAAASEWNSSSFTFSTLPWWVALLNALLAVSVNLAILSFLRYLNALYLLFAAYFKDIVTVLISVIFKDESINGTEIQGYCVLLLGLATWRVMALLSKPAPSSQMAKRPPSPVHRSSAAQREEEDDCGIDPNEGVASCETNEREDALARTGRAAFP